MSELRFGRQLYVYLVWDFYRKAFGHILVVGGSWFGLPHRNRGLYENFLQTTLLWTPGPKKLVGKARALANNL